MMKKIIVFMSLFFVSFPLMAICNISGGPVGVGVVLTKLSSDAITAPAGTILGTETFGGNAQRTATFSDCSVDDVYAITASPGVTEAVGVTGVRGGKVYETGVPGIGFEFTELITGHASSPVPAVLGTIPAYGLNSKPGAGGRLMTVWFIKTRDNIDTSFTGTKTIDITFSAGDPGLIGTNDTELFRLEIKIGKLIYRTGSCDITPRGGSTINLQPIDLTLLKGMSQGAVTGKQEEFTLDITCTGSSVGLRYRYWFNPISDASTEKDGVLLNSINELSGGAKNVGLIVKQGTKPIVFFDTDNYEIKKTSAFQSLDFTADYYKVANDISAGTVRAMMEVIIQEK